MRSGVLTREILEPELQHLAAQKRRVLSNSDELHYKTLPAKIQAVLQIWDTNGDGSPGHLRSSTERLVLFVF